MKITFEPKITKKDTILFWVSTLLIVLLDGFPGVFSNTPMAIEGMRHLGFPDYFRIELGVAKVLGAFALVLPMVPNRVKEWAYVGFGISMISAFIAYAAVDGLTPMLIGPVIGFVILSLSYIYFLKTRK